MFLPKKNVKKIENVDSSSLLSLKALIDRTKKKKKKKRKSEPSVGTKKRKNAGVEKQRQGFGVQRRGEKEIEAFEEGVGEESGDVQSNDIR